MIRIDGVFQQTCKQLKYSVIEKYEPVMGRIAAKSDNQDLKLVKFIYDTMVQGLEKFRDYPHDDPYALRAVQCSVEDDIQLIDNILKDTLNLVHDGTWKKAQYYQIFSIRGQAKQLVFETEYLKEAEKFMDNYSKFHPDNSIFMEINTESLLD